MNQLFNDRITYPTKVLLYNDLNDSKLIENSPSPAISIQYESLKKIYKTLLDYNEIFSYDEIENSKSIQTLSFDLVFPWIDSSGEKVLFINAVSHFDEKIDYEILKDFFINKGYKLIQLKSTSIINFKNLIPHPGSRIIWMKIQSPELEELGKTFNFQPLSLSTQLDHTIFLKDCFMPISAMEAVVCDEAFDNDNLRKLRDEFGEIYTIPKEEAILHKALSSSLVLSKRKRIAVLNNNSIELNSLLKRRLFEIYEIEFTELEKLGFGTSSLCKLYF